MPRICALALAMVVAIGGTLLGSSIHACDDRFAASCQHGLIPSSPKSEAFAQRPSNFATICAHRYFVRLSVPCLTHLPTD